MCTICLELKPKCGFLPTSACIHPKHAIKQEISRFQLHQHLKCAQVSGSHLIYRVQSLHHSIALCKPFHILRCC